MRHRCSLNKPAGVVLYRQGYWGVSNSDDQSQAIFLRLDRNGDGRADVIIFDLKRSGRWDLSFWDENFTGYWTLVGYHDDGSTASLEIAMVPLGRLREMTG